MLEYDINGRRLNSLDYKILNYLEHCLGKKLNEEEIKFNKNKHYIQYRRRIFAYKIEEGTIKVFECSPEIRCVIELKPSSRKKRNIKTKKGKVTKEKVIIISLASLVTGVALFNTSHMADNFTKENKEYTAEMHMEDLIKPTIIPEVMIIDEEEEIEQMENIFVQIPEVSTDAYYQEKRKQTDEYLGETIEEYAKRYGFAASCFSALITHERKEDITSANPAQITTYLCGGNGFHAPTFENGEYIGEEKVFILGKYYDNYPLEDLNTMGHFPKFSKAEQEEVQKAIKLQNDGYHVYRFTDIVDKKSTESIKLNLQIAAIYFSSLINEKQDLFRGMVSYNAGPSRVNKVDSYEVLFRGYENADDPLYMQHIARYFKQEDYEKGFTIQLRNRKIHYAINPTITEVKNEKITDFVRR